MGICYLCSHNITRNPWPSMITYKWKVSLKLGEDVVFWRVLNFLFCRVVGVGQMRLSSMYGLIPRLVPVGVRGQLRTLPPCLFPFLPLPPFLVPSLFLISLLPRFEHAHLKHISLHPSPSSSSLPLPLPPCEHTLYDRVSVPRL